MSIYFFLTDLLSKTNLIDKLEVGRYVSLLGNLPNEEVLQMMRESHIFIFTSDRGEGWGVVLSEAMANGCTVVASNKIGAAPFLVKHKKNVLNQEISYYFDYILQ